MSTFSAPTKETFTLALSNLPLDANVTIYDGGRDQDPFEISGKSSISEALAKGLYVVRGELAGLIRETHVRRDRDVSLTHSESIQLVPPQYTAAPLEGTALSHEYYRYPSQEWSLKQTRPPFKPSSADSSLFIFIRPREAKDATPSSEERRSYSD